MRLSSDPQDLIAFAVNVKNIEWTHLAMNHAYGVKHYVLKEEAALPSSGYNDTLVRMKKYTTNLGDWAPWGKNINWDFGHRSLKDM